MYTHTFKRIFSTAASQLLKVLPVKDTDSFPLLRSFHVFLSNQILLFVHLIRLLFPFLRN